ncbi:MAG: family 43 glycosylhydrolase [Planctomycetota bacterium]|nr:family 43 glycosylhydrolase [Planctomycetota bacterium]
MNRYAVSVSILALSTFTLTFAAPPASQPDTRRASVAFTGSGISGPGQSFSPSGPVYVKRHRPNSSALRQGLIPDIKPVLDLHIRDTIIRPGGDGNYYLTGSTGDDIWKFNDGVELWRSPDLQHWDYLGVVWNTQKDGTWEKTPRDLHGVPVVTIWAPEIIYLKSKHNYFIALSMAPSGISILKSTTGQPRGPYINCVPGGGQLRGGIDPTLFEDDDGKVYFANASATSISLMKDDMSGFAETHKVQFADPDHNPDHHAARCEARGMNDLGTEGAVFFKANGKYYLGAADSYQGRYSTCMGIADNIWGPYHMRFEAIPGAGGGDFFQDKSGDWWATYFGNDNQQPWREMPGIIKVNFAPDGKIIVAKEQPLWNLLSANDSPAGSNLK